MTSLHTIFVRLHNQFEAEVFRLNPSWPGERLYQETRHLIIAIWQSIVVNEFLPVVLGRTEFERFLGGGNAAGADDDSDESDSEATDNSAG